ncbi:DUF6134 family protein [Ekhidna sp.]|uniref:DUF6134 family protein n=1 Tax=Ekhidna sp. TaxID=2608089 RepID=UPI003BACF2D7
MKRNLIILIFTIVSQAALGQTLNYEVIKGSKKLGDMTVKRKLSQNEVKYEINSKVTFRILFSFTVDYESTSEYQYGKLIKEYTHNQLNGSTQKKSTIWFDGEKYTLDLDGIRTTMKDQIDYSVATVYFEEPKDRQKVYSPQFGQYMTFNSIGEHVYELESPDGLNIYTYTNGICTEVKVNRDFAKFAFVMTPESLIAVKTKKIVGGSQVVD